MANQKIKMGDRLREILMKEDIHTSAPGPGTAQDVFTKSQPALSVWYNSETFSPLIFTRIKNVIETHPKLKKYNPNYLRYPDSPMLVEDIGKTPVTKDEIELELMQEILDKKKEIILLKSDWKE